MKNSKNNYWESKNSDIPLESRMILNEYLLSLKLENKAISTVIRYCGILERFLNECRIPLSELQSEDVRKWIEEFSKGKKPKTINLVIFTLTSFLNFCLDEEYMEVTVMKKRWRPRIPKSLPRYLDEYEYARVKRFSEQLPLRNRAIVLFLFTSGCRVSEVTNLNIDDVNIAKRTAVVLGKGKKIRHVHFSEECALVLQAYLKTRSCDSTKPLFLNRYGQRFHERGIQLILKLLGKEVGLNQKLHPHVCRHTFATNMLARGADLQFIADEMGHEDLNTTRVYAQIPTEDLKMKYQNIMG
jgi:integrase/recombinase XerD